MQCSRWQKLGGLDDDAFEARVASQNEKAPAGRIGRRFRLGELAIPKPVQLMGRTNRKNYIALNSYQP
jgi:hypothetical protein